MNKLFVDTNAFEKIGYNFSEKNLIIKTLIQNVRDKKYEYYSLSVIDGEISSHLNQRGDQEYKLISNRKWIKKYISDEKIREHCYKDLVDYNNFKINISAKKCDISSVNSEEIFKKYFKVEYPFENRKEKRKEFPDAFIVSYVNSIEISNNEEIYFVTNDKGIKNALKEEIEVFDDLNEFLAKINNASPDVINKIKDCINNKLKDIQEELLNKIELKSIDLNYENLQLDNLVIQKITDIDIISHKDKQFFVNCKCDFLILDGEFICEDYTKSYSSMDDIDFFVLNRLLISDYEFSIIVSETEEDYKIEFQEKYVFPITYELMQEISLCNYYDYDGEDEWAQD